MPKHRIRTMHLDKPFDGEFFMKREGVDPDKTPDDEPEWLDNDADLDYDADEADDEDTDEDENGTEEA